MILEREWGTVIGLLAELDEAAWQRPTRCHGWTVLDLAHHVVWGVSMEADALRRARDGQSDPADGQVLSPETPPGATLAALRRATASLYAEVASLGPGDDTLACPMPYGATPLPVALDVFVFEAGIHASDFAEALGEDRPLVDDVVPATARVLSAFLPHLAQASTADPPAGSSFRLRGDTVSVDGTWSEAGLAVGTDGRAPTVTVAGDDSSVLLFAVGRLGVDDPRVTVTGSTALAREFKTHVPGP